MELLLDFLAAFGTSIGDAGYNAAVDFNGDGNISVQDLFMMLANWSTDAASATSSSK
jgi:hypothetical protein